MLDKEVFQKGMKIISIITSKLFTTEQLDVYYMLLSDINNDCFAEGIKQLAKEREFSNIPTPAEIRKYCLFQLNEINKLCREYGTMIENTRNIEYYNVLKKELEKFNPALVEKKLQEVKQKAKAIFDQNKLIENRPAKFENLEELFENYKNVIN